MRNHSIPRQARDGEQSRTILTLAIIALLVCTAAEAKYSGGTGEPNDPYQIADANNLLALAADTNDYSKCFILTADVNLAGQVWTTAIIASDTNSDFMFQGIAFEGTFDGNGHKITGFIINGGGNWYIGLFGVIGSYGSVRNLSLENFVVNGYVYVGGLVGVSSGSISNCYSQGQLSCYSCVGGLVGANSGSINNCYSTGQISDTHDIVGGLVGWNSGSISNCYSTSTVSSWSWDSDPTGGLVGWNSGGISNCYSTGTVSGGGKVGGLAGRNYGSISNCYSTSTVSGFAEIGGLVGMQYGSISNCYSSGSVSGPYDIGGLVGRNFVGSGSVSGSFWDTQTSGQTTSAGGTGKTTAEMKTLSTFTSAGWDFTSVWVLPLGQYPMLFLRQAGDLNLDGRVNMFDLAILAQHWLEGTGQ
jgi:hypothetical protein